MTSTLGAVATAVPTVAVWLSPAFRAIRTGLPTIPVAVKVIGAPLRPTAIAISVLVPAAVPSVQLPTEARPSTPVTSVSPVMLPTPDVTAKMTVTPETGWPLPSVTITVGAVATIAPTTAV